MFKTTLLLLTLSGLQAVPIAAPRGFQETLSNYHLSDIRDFRREIEPSRRFINDINSGLVQDYISGLDRRADFINPSLGNGFGEMDRRHQLIDEVPVDIPLQRSSGGWVRMEELSAPDLPDRHEPFMKIPDGFRQGTEPFMKIPDAFRQGTEPFIKIPDAFRQGTEPFMKIPNGFRQGTEPFMKIPDGFRQGTEPFMKIPDGFRQGTEPFMKIPDGFRQGTEPFMKIPDGFRQGTEPFMKIPDGFRQGTDPFMKIPDGFRQGTEPFMKIPDGFRQGTEPFMKIPDGFRQGTEPFMKIPDGFRQGTEPFIKIPDGYRQGTEPFMKIPDGFREGTKSLIKIPDGFRQGTEPLMKIPDGFRQGTKSSKIQTPLLVCKGEIINGNCYEFNPTPLAFEDSRALCAGLAPNAELASITSGDLHSHLVSLVTKGGDDNPVLTWLGGMVKNQQASWVDGSEWSYSDWMPGQPNVHSDKPVCIEMFMMEESWWTAADCELKRASICSYPVAA